MAASVLLPEHLLPDSQSQGKASQPSTLPNTIKGDAVSRSAFGLTLGDIIIDREWACSDAGSSLQ